MTNDLFILIKQDRENLADLTRGIAQADPDNRARRTNDAINQVAMMVHGENVVIYPPLQESSAEGAAMVEESLKHLRSIVDDFDRLERMTFSDLAYPSFFDQTFDCFLHHWDVEDRALRMLQDVMTPMDFGLLGPRWIAARPSAPTRPLEALRAAEPSATVATPGQQPEKQVAPAAQGQMGQQQPITFTQRIHHILDSAQDVLARMKHHGQKKEQDSGGDHSEGQKKDCGCTGTCTCPPKSAATAGKKKDCGCTGVCTCPPKRAAQPEQKPAAA
ncbi:hypothetical protein BGX24_011931 [Mortierella sp. AD032]|nr:hypothetical protein BGX24_011931 [Mortierella sp. AD032]